MNVGPQQARQDEDLRPIGGFLGLELPAGDSGLLRLWKVADDLPAFDCARSAFAALLQVTSGTVWLPAYLCPEFAAVVSATRRRHYAIDADLRADIAALQSKAQAGDLVVGVDYFGRPPDREFLAFAAARPDLLFVEDAAQALDTGLAPWADWRLLSPRKLVGVPDGGLIVPVSCQAQALRLPWPESGSLHERVAGVLPQLARFEDAGERENQWWHSLNQSKEAVLGRSPRAISHTSRALLAAVDVARVAARRRQNFEVLAGALARYALLPDVQPSFVPLGFPVRVPAAERDALLARLHVRRIFPAVHWRRMQCDRAEFSAAHALAAESITLPCDQRYSVQQMHRLVKAFLEEIDDP